MMSRFDGNRLSIVALEGVIEINSFPAFIPPMAPQNLSAVAGDTLVDLNWDDNTEADLAYYKVYQDGVEIATNVLTSDYQVTGLTNGIQYAFTVTAVDDDGNESAFSNEVLATPSSAQISAYSLSFDGVDDHVVANQPYDGTGDFTIEAYIKTSTTALGNIVALRQSAIGTSQATQLLACRIFSTGEIEFLSRDSGGIIHAFSTVNAYNNNTWYRAVCSRQGTQYRIRVLDTVGTILENITLAGNANDIVDLNSKLILGTYTADTANERYAGLMDDVRIWDDYRTDAEIINNANVELAGTEANLVWYAPAEAGTGTLLDDITAGNRDGTITGATWSTDTGF